MRYLMLALLSVLVLAGTISANDRSKEKPSDQPGNPWRWTDEDGGYWWRWKMAAEALDEVNATRAARGLPPFVKDDGLTQAAVGAAKYRAEHLMAGHTSNDFAFLPAGASAPAAGCAAWEPSLGWGSCCTYDSYTYAGAAYAYGSDGRRYMHLFVR
jgi:hypothetical protein